MKINFSNQFSKKKFSIENRTASQIKKQETLWMDFGVSNYVE